MQWEFLFAVNAYWILFFFFFWYFFVFYSTEDLWRTSMRSGGQDSLPLPVHLSHTPETKAWRVVWSGQGYPPLSFLIFFLLGVLKYVAFLNCICSISSMTHCIDITLFENILFIIFFNFVVIKFLRYQKPFFWSNIIFEGVYFMYIVKAKLEEMIW